MKRREFIKKTGSAVAGAVILPQISYSNHNVIKAGLKPNNVLIIGAGISGLAAAYKLKKNGVNVTLIEARNRVGGRILSFTLENENQQDKRAELTCELGAEWVGISHTRLIELCKEFKLELLNHQFETHLLLNGEFKKPGEWDFTPEWELKYSQLLEYFNSLPPESDAKKNFDKLDWWRYLVNQGIPEKDL